MTCKVTEEQLISFLFEELPQDEQRQIDNHISTCNICSDKIQELIKLEAIWISPECLVSDTFSEKVMSNLIQGKRRISFFQNRKLESIYNFAVAYVATYLFLYFDGINGLPSTVSKLSSIIMEKEIELLFNSNNGIAWIDKFYFQVLQFFQ
ncbi:MAG: anti-sigma factor [Vulcanibacillus sp.]